MFLCKFLGGGILYILIFVVGTCICRYSSININIYNAMNRYSFLKDFERANYFKPAYEGARPFDPELGYGWYDRCTRTWRTSMLHYGWWMPGDWGRDNGNPYPSPFNRELMKMDIGPGDVLVKLAEYCDMLRDSRLGKWAVRSKTEYYDIKLSEFYKWAGIEFGTVRMVEETVGYYDDWDFDNTQQMPVAVVRVNTELGGRKFEFPLWSGYSWWNCPDTLEGVFSFANYCGKTYDDVIIRVNRKATPDEQPYHRYTDFFFTPVFIGVVSAGNTVMLDFGKHIHWDTWEWNMYEKYQNMLDDERQREEDLDRSEINEWSRYETDEEWQDAYDEGLLPDEWGL